MPTKVCPLCGGSGLGNPIGIGLPGRRPCSRCRGTGRVSYKVGSKNDPDKSPGYIHF